MKMIIIFTIILFSSISQAATNCQGSLECLLSNASQLSSDPLSCDPEPGPTPLENACTSLFQSNCSTFDLNLSSYRSALFNHMQSLNYHEKNPEKFYQKSEELIHQGQGISHSELESLFNDVKGDILADISSMGLPPAKARELRENIENIELLNSRGVLRYVRRHGRAIVREAGVRVVNLRTLGRDLLFSMCSNDATNFQAMTIPGRFVHLCPGLMVYLSTTFGQNKNQILDSLRVIFAHEIGHSLQDETISQNLEECLNTVSIASREGLDLVAKKAMWNKHKLELSSDRWAHQALARTLRERNLRGESAIQTVSSSVAFFCSQGDMDNRFSTHPSGRTRMDLFIMNPEIRTMMGCAPDLSLPSACTQR